MHREPLGDDQPRAPRRAGAVIGAVALREEPLLPEIGDVGAEDDPVGPRGAPERERIEQAGSSRRGFVGGHGGAGGSRAGAAQPAALPARSITQSGSGTSSRPVSAGFTAGQPPPPPSCAG